MGAGNLGKCADDMARAVQSFQSAWDAARQSWKDRDKDQFERDHADEIAGVAKAYIRSIRRLAETTEAILNDVP